jgi:hypothetical protein
MMMGMCVVLLAWTGSASAELILEESFVYPELGDGNDLNGANGGTGWANAWEVDSAQLTYKETGLTYSGLATAGGASVDVNWSPNRDYDGTGMGDDGDVQWFSLLFQTSTPARQQRVFWFSNGGGSSSWGAGSEINADGNGFAAGGDTYPSGKLSGPKVGAFDDGQTHLAIGKIVWGELNPNDGNQTDVTVTVWFDADLNAIADRDNPLESELGSLMSEASGYVAAKFTSGDTGVYLRSHSGNEIVYDELRLGETLADVTPVPEPTTMALLGIGGLGALLRRRRR